MAIAKTFNNILLFFIIYITRGSVTPPVREGVPHSFGVRPLKWRVGLYIYIYKNLYIYIFFFIVIFI